LDRAHSEIDCGPSAAGTREQGLVSLPEAMELGRLGRAVAAFALVTSCVAVLGTTFVDVCFPNPIPEPIGAEKIRDDELRAGASPWDGSWARLLEHDYRLSSRVRAKSGRLYSTFLYRYLREGNDQIAIGEGGWLFLTSRIEPPRGPHERTAGAAAALLAAVDRRLHALGVRHWLVPVPRKAALYPEKLPEGVDPDPEFDRALLDALRERGMNPVDLLPAYTNFIERGDEPVYHPFETHWSQVGQVLAARTVARQSGMLVPESECRTRLVVGGKLPYSHGSDLYEIMDLEGTPADLAGPDAGPFTHFGVQGLEKLRASHDGGPDSRGKAGVVLCGTSFSANNLFNSFLSHFLDLPVKNRARAGATFEESLRLVLEAGDGKPLPSIIIEELPLHHTFEVARTRQLDEGLSGLFVGSSPESPRPVRSLEQYLSPPPAARPGNARRKTLLAQVPAGVLAHSGTGTLSLRLRTRHPDTPTVVDVSSGGYYAKLAWPAGRKEVVFPLLSDRPACDAVLIAARNHPERPFELESLEVVGEYAPEPIATGAPGSVEPVAGEEPAWRQVITFAGEPRLPSLGAVLVRMSGEQPSPLVHVVLECLGRQPVTTSFEGLAPGAVIALDPGPLAGEVLEEVRLLGPGAPPAAVAERVELLAPIALDRLER